VGVVLESGVQAGRNLPPNPRKEEKIEKAKNGKGI